ALARFPRKRAGRKSGDNMATKHGHSPKHAPTPEYTSWLAMRSRCFNRNNRKWPRYGGRGIVPCAAWAEFPTFLSDMGPRPSGTSIDRINNDGGYWCGKCEECVAFGRQSNCRWATDAEQVMNRGRYKSRYTGNDK